MEEEQNLFSNVCGEDWWLKIWDLSWNTQTLKPKTTPF
jgi:hypothetical protein